MSSLALVHLTRLSAPSMAKLPSSVQERPLSAPPKDPRGVLAAPAMIIGFEAAIVKRLNTPRSHSVLPCFAQKEGKKKKQFQTGQQSTRDEGGQGTDGKERSGAEGGLRDEATRVPVSGGGFARRTAGGRRRRRRARHGRSPPTFHQHTRQGITSWTKKRCKVQRLYRWRERSVPHASGRGASGPQAR